MASRSLNKLSVKAVNAASEPGRYGDGGGLHLNIAKGGTKSWVFLFTRRGKRIEMGLGPYPAVGLADARDKAALYRAEVAAGRDPRTLRDKDSEPTFGECAEKLIATMESGWRNAKHRQQWKNTLNTYCSTIWDRPVSEVDIDAVLSVLQPIWKSLPETASRVRGRIERVIEFATAKGWRQGTNPAIWRGSLRALLPKPERLQRGHHAAMAYRDVPAFVADLRTHVAMSARALEFLILTASRTSEVLDARWGEVDLDGKVWTVPAPRMKRGRIHRVPLADRAVAILRALEQSRVSDLVFPSDQKDRALSNMSMAMLMRRMEHSGLTVHGFRSAFRDWAGDATAFPRELAEAALSHKVGDDTEAAYRRGDALEKRRKLMNAWAKFIESSIVKKT